MNRPIKNFSDIESLSYDDKYLLEDTYDSARFLEDSDVLYFKNPDSPLKFFAKEVFHDSQWEEIDISEISTKTRHKLKVCCEAAIIEHNDGKLYFNENYQPVELDITDSFDAYDDLGVTQSELFGFYTSTAEFILTDWPLKEMQEYNEEMQHQRDSSLYEKIEEQEEAFRKAKGPEIDKSINGYDSTYKSRPENDSYKYDNYEFEKVQGRMEDPDVNGIGHCR